MNKFLLCCLLFFFSNSAFTQIKVHGTITNQEELPLEGVQVEASEKKATTDASGNYEIMLVEGAHEIKVSHPDFVSQMRTIVVKKEMRLDFELRSSITELDEVTIAALRMKKQSPMSYSEMKGKEISERNLGQDIPILLNYLPSVVTTSDAGAGVGYTGMRVRGSDATRTNVVINGVPYNDSESQGTFWVDLPDFASSVENIQLSRGVGSSTNGSGAFGANLSLTTDGIKAKPSAEITNTFGSFNTRKHNLKFNTGLMNDHFQINGSLSKIKSDGYVDRASSDLSSYFLQAGYLHKNTQIKFLAFGGFEETYQSWYGVDPVTLENNRTENFAGIYFDENGDVQYHDNQVDHYNQDHYQLIFNQKISNNLSLNLTGHYTWGRGYFEEFKEDDDLADYNISNLVIDTTVISTADIIRRRWLDNDFYGAIASLNYSKNNWTSNLGVSYNEYKGDHFGEVIWTQIASNSSLGDRYYENFGDKKELNIFLKNTWNISKHLSAFADMQLRNVDYFADGVAQEVVDDSFSFFNPKLGLSYDHNNGIYYVSYARANREPSRGDYENGNPVPEQLDDIELGWRGNVGPHKINLNGYLMLYKDQLVLTGELDNNGAGVRTNVGESFRRGVELEAIFRLADNLLISPNITLSQNRNIDFFTENDTMLISLGDTKIGYSPEVVMANRISYSPKENLNISLFTKYVGEQYMSNVEAPLSLLDAYLVNDLLLSYTIKPKSGIKAIELSLLVNNILDEQYSSNGYWFPGGPGYDEGVGFYPQAGTNFLAGVKLKF